MEKSQGTPLLAAVGNGPPSPAYGCVKPRLAFSLESPLDESGGQAREIKLKSFPSGAREIHFVERFWYLFSWKLYFQMLVRANEEELMR